MWVKLKFPFLLGEQIPPVCVMYCTAKEFVYPFIYVSHSMPSSGRHQA